MGSQFFCYFKLKRFTTHPFELTFSLLNLETGKNKREVLTDQDQVEYMKTLTYWDKYADKMAEQGYAVYNEELPYQEMRWKHGNRDFSINNIYDKPYEQDLSAFPEGKLNHKLAFNFE